MGAERASSPGAPVRVLLADDQRLVREGMRMLLELEGGIEIVGEAADGAAAAAAYASRRPDVVLMDIRMPVMDGVEATRRIRALDPEARILILTTFDEDTLVLDAVRAGARGYLLKDLAGPELAKAVRDVAAGGAALQGSVALKVMDAYARLAGGAARPGSGDGAARRPPSEPLSGREKSVLRCLAQGLSNKEIADRLFLAEGTVKNHVTAILQKIGARDRTQAALLARDLGLLGPEDR